jgi:hypothetical protein
MDKWQAGIVLVLNLNSESLFSKISVPSSIRNLFCHGTLTQINHRLAFLKTALRKLEGTVAYTTVSTSFKLAVLHQRSNTYEAAVLQRESKWPPNP